MSFKDRKFGILAIRHAVDEHDKWIPWSPYADRFYCDCKCGNELVVWRSLLLNNVQLDCGMCRCRRRDGKFHVRKNHHVRHTKKKDGTRKVFASGEFNTWSQMLNRCSNPRHHAYDNYGGRGIRVCARWREGGTAQGFPNFLKDMGPRPFGKTLDRINPQGHYEPTNCRWADKEVQVANQRRFIFRDMTPPPVEKVREMEARIRTFEEEMELEMHPF